ncbi:DMT family transporter [Kribbella sancticallisti]|uniref:DMT family transporter n=2 Tax=Kribbella sancticallisti TaxID=460087 RepID=A0ABN2DTQ6_9ACTN
MFLVGTLAAVSGVVNTYPLFGGQAIRYVLSAVVLLGVARIYGLGFLRPSATEVVLFSALAATGLVLFNVFVIHATRHAGPATVGTVIGAVPIVLAIAGPALNRRRLSRRVLFAAMIVVAGTALTSGLGTADAAGVLLSIGALVCEACFTLLALPLLIRYGPIRVSAYTAALAAPMLLALGAVTDRGGLLRTPSAAEAGGFVYLAVVVGAGAFLLWYGALPRLGADRAGLFAGMVPIGAIVTGTALGLGAPSGGELLGVLVVVAGLLIGLAPSLTPRQAQTHDTGHDQGDAGEAGERDGFVEQEHAERDDTDRAQAGPYRVCRADG